MAWEMPADVARTLQLMRMRLFSVEARRAWLEPDLQALPPWPTR